ncbi:hypothetical protein [Candidatus Stoquefichus massiliensis]|uniref:hypothetical protein n=1 Tax=Candidatus Stoquefichus massiliensis TaxID=1470350 RepID=UPI0004805283|nr:hypothetical protein [Candidatus Stoquefichus massiliensis]
MIATYYTKGYDSHELFNNLKIANTDHYEKHMNQYNVIYIDLGHLPDLVIQMKNILMKLKGTL